MINFGFVVKAIAQNCHARWDGSKAGKWAASEREFKVEERMPAARSQPLHEAMAEPEEAPLTTGPTPCPSCLEGFAPYLNANDELHFYGRQPTDEARDEMERHREAIDAYLDDVRNSERYLNPSLAALIRETLGLTYRGAGEEDAAIREWEMLECMYVARNQPFEEAMREWRGLFLEQTDCFRRIRLPEGERLNPEKSQRQRLNSLVCGEKPTLS